MHVDHTHAYVYTETVSEYVLRSEPITTKESDMSDYITHTVRSQATGEDVAILNLRAEGAVIKPEEGTPWAVACLAHFWVVYTETRRDAHAVGRVMDAYCPDCGGFDYDEDEVEA